MVPPPVNWNGEPHQQHLAWKASPVLKLSIRVITGATANPMLAASEVDQFLSAHSAPIVGEARRLVESRSVKLVHLSAELIEADVALEEGSSGLTARRDRE